MDTTEKVVGQNAITKLISLVKSALGNKVEKVSGKELSSNDFTTVLKNKLDGIASGAEVNVQSDWNQTDTSKDDYIKNKPTSMPPTAHTHDGSEITGKVSSATSADILDSTALANNTDLNTIKGRSSGVRWYNGNARSNTYTNIPSGLNNEFILGVTNSANSDYCLQTIFDAVNGLWTRKCNNGTWTSWVKVMNQDCTFPLSITGNAATASNCNYSRSNSVDTFVVKRTHTGGGAFVRFNPKNQDTNYWRCGSSTEADKFIIHKGEIGDIVEVAHSSTNDTLTISGAKGAGVKASGVSGDISLVSSDSGSARGLWLGAHGTATSGKWAMNVDTNNNVTLNGNAATATKATQDESGNNIKASYASSLGTSDNSVILKNKSGATLSSITVPYATNSLTSLNANNATQVNGWKVAVGAFPSSPEANTIYFVI